ncbi:MAG TPA: P-loop NTPase [Acidobacteriota bacterium]|nr:P-loop NTPase [Acidobacteriota bacterium]
MSRFDSSVHAGDYRAVGGSWIVSVLSGKGGVGKSVLAFNLAERIGSQGNRVLLVDADFSSGNIHILANASCETGVRQFSSGQLSLRDAVVPVLDGVDVLGAGGDGPAEAWQDVQATARLVERLRDQGSHYDVIVVDHSSGVSDPATVIAQGSDLNLLVLVPELTSIADAYGLYKYLLQAGDRMDAFVLVNRTQSDREAEYIHGKFSALAERFLGRAPGLIGYLPEDEAVRKAVASQVPVAVAMPQSPVVQALSELGQELLGLRKSSRTGTQVKAINKTTAAADIRG